MNLEQAIHEHWAESTALESLLSASRLTTGQSCTGIRPYATLQLRTLRRRLPTNQGAALEERGVRLSLWHDRYDEIREVAEQVRETFDGATLVVTESDRTARLRHAADSIKQHRDGWWQWTVDFVAKVYLLQ
ncbi:MAG: hypothetical protein JW888_15665 [Pirellulales bacterium]|nr:hypothetical protein [Pirellulales bacterium]